MDDAQRAQDQSEGSQDAPRAPAGAELPGGDLPPASAGCRESPEPETEGAAAASQEAIFRQFVKHTPAAVAMFDREMRYLVYTRNWQVALGHEGCELAGRGLYEMRPLAVRWREAHLRALAGLVQRCEEEEVPHPDGGTTWVRWEIRPWYEPDGAIGGVIIFLEQITESKLAQEALRTSEERFRLLSASAPVGIFQLDAAGQCTYVNARWQEITGLSAEQAMGSGWMQGIHPEDRAQVAERWARVTREQREWSRETRLLRPDGRVRWAYKRAMPLRSKEGEVIGYVGTLEDITERRRAAENSCFLAEAGRVLASSLEYEATLQSIAHLAVPVLGDWCILYVFEDHRKVRRAAVAYANPERAELARRLESCPTPDPARALPALPALQEGKPQIFYEVPETVLQALATSEEHLEVLHDLHPAGSLTVPFRARGRLLGIAHFFVEHGRHYEAEDLALAEELGNRAAIAVDNARLYQEARLANAEKEQLLAVLSHELRNPLAPILAGVAVLRRAISEDERVLRTVDIIDRNVKLQARLINDLLDLSRISRGKLQLQQAPVRLDNVVSSALQTQQPDAAQAGLSLRVNLEGELWVMGDPDRLQQVVMNLLSNAIKFTPAGGEIRVTCAGHGPEQVRLVVEDTGIGIPHNVLPELFRMFRQGDVAGQHKPGLGIGLALVKSLVEKHGGQVWAESEGPGKGSRFTVELPRVAAPTEAHGGRDPRATEELTKVLLVEDNLDTSALLADSLRGMGYQVQSAASAEEGLTALRRSHPDVILADIGLPGMDGYEFLTRARQLPGMEKVTAFAVTGFAQKEDVERAQAAGYAGHFVKPVDVAALDRHIRGGRARES